MEKRIECGGKCRSGVSAKIKVQSECGVTKPHFHLIDINKTTSVAGAARYQEINLIYLIYLILWGAK